MATSQPCRSDSAPDALRLADLALRHHHTDEALRLAREKLESLQAAAQRDEMQMCNWLGKVQWLLGHRAELQEAMDRLSDGVRA